MHRLPILAVILALLVPGLVRAQGPTPTASEEDVPRGVPAGATPAEVVDNVDGDKVRVSVGGSEEEVLLIGADAPEPKRNDKVAECYAKESGERLAAFLSPGRTVYLEADEQDKDGKDRLLRYVWVAADGGRRTYMVNERMIAEGYATFAPREDQDRYDERLKEAQATAKEEQLGLWKLCGSGHLPGSVLPPIKEDNPLYARLGGTREDFEAVYGESVESGSGSSGSYEVEGFGLLFGAIYFEGQLVNVSLFADRNLEGEALTKPHEADWTVEEAMAIAGRFAPTDTELGEATPSDSGNTLVPGMSETLAATLSPDAYAWVDASGAPGEVQYVLYLDDAGEVFAIDVNLGGVED